MLITNLVEIGRPFLADPVEPAQLLPRVSSVSEKRADRFYGATLIVEVDHTDRHAHEGGPTAPPGPAYAAHEPTRIDAADPRRLGLPLSIPSGGGNKTGPMGHYSLPVYPLYEKILGRILQRNVDDKTARTPDEARVQLRDFFRLRAARTSGCNLSEAQLYVASDEAYDRIASDIGSGYDGAALIVLAEIGDGTPYYYSPIKVPDYLTSRLRSGADGAEQMPMRSVVVAHSRLHPGHLICADLTTILDGALEAKVQEGAQLGELDDGQCMVCGDEGRVVAAYSPAWPFAAKTWSAPLPMNGANTQKGLGTHNRALATALCVDCYRAFAVGIPLFKRLSRLLPRRVAIELKAPAHSGPGRQAALARTRQQRQPPLEKAAAFATPLISSYGGRAAGTGRGYARALAAMAEGEGRTLSALVGAESTLPDELARDEYRITTVFYQQPDPQQEGVLELRAVIEDIVPSRMLALEAIIRNLSFDTRLDRLAGNLSVRSLADRGLATLPYLIGRAYGREEFFKHLTAALMAQPLPDRPFRQRAARRLRDLSKNIRDNAQTIRQEVYFYLAFDQFFADYLHHVAPTTNGDCREGAVKRATQLLDIYRDQHPMYWPLEAQWDIGFACGHLLKDFSRKYYAVKKKDLLEDRVKPVAGDLDPRTVTTRGVAKIDEIASRIGTTVRPDLREKAGYVLAAHQENQPSKQDDKDGFMLGFKSGYWTSKWIPASRETQPPASEQQRHGVS